MIPGLSLRRGKVDSWSYRLPDRRRVTLGDALPNDDGLGHIRSNTLVHSGTSL